MTISSDFINPYSSLSRKVFKPVENILIETIPISVEFVIALVEPNYLPRLIHRRVDDASINFSGELDDFKRMMNCYAEVMDRVIRDYPLARPSLLIFILHSEDDENYEKKLTIRITPERITYDLQHQGNENRNPQQDAPIQWKVPVHPSQVEYVEL